MDRVLEWRDFLKKQRVISVIMLCMVLISGCSTSGASGGTGTSSGNQQTDCYSNLFEADDQEIEVKKIMEKEELSNVAEFFKWVNRFNRDVGSNAGLTGEWTPIEKMNYKDSVISSNWEAENKGKTDANSRIAAFLILKDKIKTKGLENSGSYLTRDINELESNSRYKILSKSKKDYIALFHEVSAADAEVGEDYEKAFPDAWKERGVKFPKGNVSLISVIMNDPDAKVLHVGHCGILLKTDEGIYYFVEKLGAFMPYQVTKFKTKKELSNMLLGRKEYRTEKEDYHAFVLENDKVME